MNSIYKFMELALDEARKSGIDIPVGCVIEKDGVVIAKEHNLREKSNDVTMHAEIIALRKASKALNNWKLQGCNLYVTLEPCPMCCWAILNSRIENVYFGAYDEQYGAMGSKLDLSKMSSNKTKYKGGILEEECREIIIDYFKRLRN